MIPGGANSLLLASAAGAPAPSYQIERSLRFNSSDSAYLARTPSVTGNRKTWTWAGWVKIGNMPSTYGVFAASTSTTDYTSIYFQGQTLKIEDYVGGGQYVSAQVFRDPSAWYHIVLSVDTTKAATADRVLLYVNGAVASWGTSANWSQNLDTRINSTYTHAIGSLYGHSTASSLFDGYLADIHFIDGQALTPSSFGYTDANGVWQPKAYTGTYGTNGFHLTFSDNSTAASLGDDTSGNNNDWTVNNISVAAGAGNDSLVDVPTNGSETDTGVGGEVRGNYATWNPSNYSSNFFSDGNLKFNPTLGYNDTAKATLAIGDKCYFEVEILSPNTGQDYLSIGLMRQETQVLIGSTTGYNIAVGASGNYTGSVGYHPYTGRVEYNGSNVVTGLTTCGVGDIVGISYDPSNGQVKVYKNGTALNSGNAVYTLSTSYNYVPAMTEAANNAYYVNFGQRPFAYTAPSGFKALCTANLPSTTITTSGSYTGNGVADGPFVYLNGVPTAMTVNGNAVTFGTHADKLSNGFKIRTTSTTFNQNASTYNYSITTTGAPFKTARAQSN